LDGGATTTQIPDTSIIPMQNITPVKGRQVEVADGTRYKTVALGDVGVIKNAAYTPGLKHALISEMQLIEQGYTIHKNNVQEAEIRCATTGALKGIATVKGRMWMIDPLSIQPLDDHVIEELNQKRAKDYANMGKSQNLKDSYTHWHLVTGLPEHRLRELQDCQAIEGLKLSKTDLEKEKPI
jgi:hypothetical protein